MAHLKSSHDQPLHFPLVHGPCCSRFLLCVCQIMGNMCTLQTWEISICAQLRSNSNLSKMDPATNPLPNPRSRFSAARALTSSSHRLQQHPVIRYSSHTVLIITHRKLSNSASLLIAALPFSLPDLRTARRDRRPPLGSRENAKRPVETKHNLKDLVKPKPKHQTHHTPSCPLGTKNKQNPNMQRDPRTPRTINATSVP